MRRVAIKAVLIGGIVDIVLSTVLALPSSFYAISKVDLTNTRADQRRTVVSEALRKNIPLQVVQLLLGMGCSIFAGYLAASIAKHNELLNGALSSIFCIMLGAFSIYSGIVSYPLIVQIALELASPILGLLGGYFKIIRKTAHSRT